LYAEYGPRGKDCAPAALEAVGGTPAHEAENRFWTTATPIVRTFGHGGGSAEGNWINELDKNKTKKGWGLKKQSVDPEYGDEKTLRQES